MHFDKETNSQDKVHILQDYINITETTKNCTKIIYMVFSKTTKIPQRLQRWCKWLYELYKISQILQKRLHKNDMYYIESQNITEITQYYREYRKITILYM